ncbi:unnamed protein product [Owenia fusiformis]|uniref:WD repeat, SAM and U-box domain-containing protein 1 n=1 Tax=Owenia fusiformis TaxID=6347 RepID=A0A8S4N3E0_OWEFU|nr:unnamed protein product [Owenia fusiformis]
MSAATVGSLKHKITAHNGDVTGVAFSNKTFATCSGDKTLRLWSTIDWTELPFSPLCEHKYMVHCVTFSPFGGQLATSSTDGRAIVWDARSAKKIVEFEHSSRSSIRVCRFSPDSTLLATGCDDDTVCLWDIGLKKLKSQFEGGHEAAIVALGFSPCGSYLCSGTPDGDLKVWDAKYGHGKFLAEEKEAHDLGVNCCEFSPSYGSAAQLHFLLATGGHDNTVKLWDVISDVAGSPNLTVALRDTLIGHSESVMCLNFSPNGKILASGSGDKTVKLWNPLKGEVLHTISGHGRYVMCCAFSTDGDLLATGSNDKTVCLWNIVSEEELANAPGYEEEEEDLVIVNPDSLKDFTKWKVEDVCKWLAEIGLTQYQENFKKNAIDGTELKTLNDTTLNSALGIGALGHRNKILRSIQRILEHPYVQPLELDAGVPDEYLCPITREVMRDPVIASDGYTYERSALESWVKSGKSRSPMTNAPLLSTDLTPNRSLKMLIARHSLKS